MCSKGWGYRCPTAKGTRCTCSCGRARGISKAEFNDKAEGNPLFYLDAPEADKHEGD